MTTTHTRVHFSFYSEREAIDLSNFSFRELGNKLRELHNDGDFESFKILIDDIYDSPEMACEKFYHLLRESWRDYIWRNRTGRRAFEYYQDNPYTDTSEFTYNDGREVVHYVRHSTYDPVVECCRTIGTSIFEGHYSKFLERFDIKGFCKIIGASGYNLDNLRLDKVGELENKSAIDVKKDVEFLIKSSPEWFIY